MPVTWTFFRSCALPPRAGFWMEPTMRRFRSGRPSFARGRFEDIGRALAQADGANGQHTQRPRGCAPLRAGATVRSARGHTARPRTALLVAAARRRRSLLHPYSEPQTMRSAASHSADSRAQKSSMSRAFLLSGVFPLRETARSFLAQQGRARSLAEQWFVRQSPSGRDVLRFLQNFQTGRIENT